MTVGVRIRRPPRIQAVIPSASMADIAFLLLIFFLTCTIFRFENGLIISLPHAASAVPLSRQKATHVWVGRDGTIVIDDQSVAVEAVGGILTRKLTELPGLAVALEIDRDTPYETVDRIVTELKRAGIRNVSLRSLPMRGRP